MGETARQIETRIEQTREDLGSNLRELESRVKSATDWREHFRSNPLVWAGVAFGAGVFLGALSGRRDPLAAMETGSSDVPARPSAGSSRAQRQVFEAWETIKTALVGLATARVINFLGEAIPGFADHVYGDRTRPFQSRPGATMSGSAAAGKGV
jgi:hypothetical protein